MWESIKKAAVKVGGYLIIAGGILFTIWLIAQKFLKLNLETQEEKKKREEVKVTIKKTREIVKEKDKTADEIKVEIEKEKAEHKAALTDKAKRDERAKTYLPDL